MTKAWVREFNCSLCNWIYVLRNYTLNYVNLNEIKNFEVNWKKKKFCHSSQFCKICKFLSLTQAFTKMGLSVISKSQTLYVNWDVNWHKHCCTVAKCVCVWHHFKPGKILRWKDIITYINTGTRRHIPIWLGIWKFLSWVDSLQLSDSKSWKMNFRQLVCSPY